MNQKTDTNAVKQKIISTIKSRGPSLPVHIAREIKSDMLFTSAFLSELVSEEKLKISNMRVGNSPLYFIPGQEKQLEKFKEYLNGKQKEALGILKKEGTLKDKDQEPSIRVALRSLRDFAKPFKKDDDIFWRHLGVDEDDVKGEEITKPLPQPKSEEERELGIFDDGKNSQEREKVEEVETENKVDENEEEIKEEKAVEEDAEEESDEEKEEKEEIKLPEKPKEIKVKEKPKIKKKAKTSSSKTKKEKFFDKVKSHLDEKGIILKDIVGFGRGRLSLIVEIENEKMFLMAYSKKRINETDIGRASKVAKKHGLPYVILSKGGPLKRIESLKKDLENLSEFKKF